MVADAVFANCPTKATPRDRKRHQKWPNDTPQPAIPAEQAERRPASSDLHCIMSAIVLSLGFTSTLHTLPSPSRLAVQRAPASVMVDSWYDAGARLTKDKSNLQPAGMTESVAAASPKLAAKALAYEAEIAEMQARMDAFPKKEGTMVGACACCRKTLTPLAQTRCQPVTLCPRSRRHPPRSDQGLQAHARGNRRGGVRGRATT